MSNILLTKSQLLQGSQYTEELEIEGLGKVKVRALSDGEKTQIEAEHMLAMHDAGINSEDLTGAIKASDISIEKTVALARLGKERGWKIAAKALSVPGGEEWSVDEAKGLHEDIIDQIVVKAEVLSKGKRGQVESFPGKQTGVGSEAVN